MKYRDRFKRLTDAELHDAQIATGMALDQAHESTDVRRGLLIHNARRRYWQIMDEYDRRRRRRRIRQ